MDDPDLIEPVTPGAHRPSFIAGHEEETMFYIPDEHDEFVQERARTASMMAATPHVEAKSPMLPLPDDIPEVALAEEKVITDEDRAATERERIALQETGISKEELDASENTPVPQHRGEFADEDASDPGWAKHEKHFFVLSNAGKPIYTRYGNEDKLSTIMGVIQALISFIQDDNNSLRCLHAGEHSFVFLVRGPLILCAVARSTESEAQLASQLMYMYNQIVSVLTLSQLTSIFEQRRNYDLRRLLTGTDKFLDSLLTLMDCDPSFLLTAVRCLPLLAVAREKIGQSLIALRGTKHLLFALLIANNQLITFVRPKKHTLHPTDLHLILNLVKASSSFRESESWTPMCLPKFNTKGFLHAHVSYLDADAKVCLLLFTTERDLFFELSTVRTNIMNQLNANGSMDAILASVAHGSYTTSSVDIPELRHFIYKSKSTAQYTSPTYEAPYVDFEQQKRLLRLYKFLHHRIHSPSRPLKILYIVSSNECMIGWVTSGFELYCAFGPLTTKAAAIAAVNRLLQWIKHEEEKLFILSSQLW